jgi:hypothetical protein
MPVILAIQEEETRRITVWSQPRQNSSRDPISKTITKKGWWSDSRCRPWVQTPELKKPNEQKQKQRAGLCNLVLAQVPSLTLVNAAQVKGCCWLSINTALQPKEATFPDWNSVLFST